MDPEHTDSDLREFSERLRERVCDASTCFLCANRFDRSNITREHVIPGWAQRRFGLWDQQLTLINRTRIPYRQLTVPCCTECNSLRLKPIEDAVCQASNNGLDAVRSLGDKVLFLWLGKIFYGLLYRDLSLLLDRRDPNGPTIATPELLHTYESHLFLLQEARGSLEFLNFSPGSIYVFKTQPHPDIRVGWDLCDNIDSMFMGIRMGEVGLVGALGDGGAQLTDKAVYRDLLDLPLHPIQFREICACFSYRSTLTTRTPKYVTMGTKDGVPHKVIQMPLGGLSMRPYFDDWDDAVYARYLERFTGIPYDELYQGPERVMTWLRDDSGSIRFMDLDEYPWPM